MNTSKDNPKYILNRTHALTDGVFAIAMTLLVLGIDLPEKTGNLSGDKLHQELLGQINQVYGYLISFVLLGLFWLIHNRQFSKITSTDTTHQWINIGILIFICLVPYTSSLQNDFPEDWMTNLYFHLNLFLIALLYLLNFLYAIKTRKHTSEKYKDEESRRGEKNIYIFLAVSLIAIILGFFIPEYSSMAYILIPILIGVIK